MTAIFSSKQVAAIALGGLMVAGFTGVSPVQHETRHEAAHIALLAQKVLAGLDGGLRFPLTLNGLVIDNLESALDALATVPKPTICVAQDSDSSLVLTCGVVPRELRAMQQVMASMSGSWEQRIRDVAAQEQGEVRLVIVTPGESLEVSLRSFQAYLQGYYIGGVISLDDTLTNNKVHISLDAPPNAARVDR